jgi:deoxyribodipyrimidine photo-lyase
VKYSKGLFIFRRDLRLEDNTALNKALDECETVVPCFIFDPRQVGNDNEFRSQNAIQFMTESLADLARQIKKKNGHLHFFKEKAEDVVEQLLKNESLDAVYVNKDYTPFSLKRDAGIKKICAQHKILFQSFDDCMLNPPESVLTQSGTPYGVFTAYWKNARENEVVESSTPRSMNFYQGTIKGADADLLARYAPQPNKTIAVHGGTKEGKKILAHLDKFKDYEKTRNIPSLPTTMLSAHNKFGTVSIRQVFNAMVDKLGINHPLVRQLYWRDFYIQVAYYSPYVYGQAYHKKYNDLKWSHSKKDFEAWCQGNTGFPIVDAAMRQLNESGFMHNRTRMIAGSFLTKDLHLPWLWGEKYFAQQLVDYDPAVNNGNWQWTASTGCDASPYFRIFNPWLQQKKFDPDCLYIKQWVPELKKVPNKIIHAWYKDSSSAIKGYPRPMVDHKPEAKEALKRYKAAAS